MPGSYSWMPYAPQGVQGFETHDLKRVKRTEEHILHICIILDNINTNFAHWGTASKAYSLTVCRQPLISMEYPADNHKTSTNCGPCNKRRHLHHQIRPH